MGLSHMATVIYVTININFDVQKPSVCYLRGILRRKVMLRYPWGAALPSTYICACINIICIFRKYDSRASIFPVPNESPSYTYSYLYDDHTTGALTGSRGA